MTGSENGGVVFVCSGCESRIIVDDGVREELLRGGCVVCSEGVSASNFEPVESDVDH